MPALDRPASLDSTSSSPTFPQGDSGATLRALSTGTCIVCGQGNPNGLRISYSKEANGEITAVWNPTSNWEGFSGIVHGGIVSTVLDEAMSKAVAANCGEALTAELRVRFRHPVCSGRAYLLRGWVVDRKRRRIITEGTITTSDGTEHARAWAVFLQLPRTTNP
jgi:acyl-coenzyme A thioesterase PaaI-like protein